MLLWNKMHQIKISQTPKRELDKDDIRQRIIIAAKLRLFLTKLEGMRPETDTEITLYNTSDAPCSYVRKVQRRFQRSTGGIYREEIENLNYIGREFGIEKDDFQL